MNAIPTHQPTGGAKRAVCWLDVLVFAIMVTAGLGLLSVADRVRNYEQRELKPVKEAFEQQENVPFLQTRLAMAQDELKTLQNKLFELNMEAKRLAAEFNLRAPNLRAEVLAPQNEQRIKLLTTQALVVAYEAEMPGKMQQVKVAANDTFHAKRRAELAYDEAERAFTYANKWYVLRIGVVGWVVLALATWVACRILRTRLGHGNASHVLWPGSVLMAFAFIYYCIAK